jgi:hypothetical protein
MRKLSVSTLVTLDGIVQDPGGFGETGHGGWANPCFTADAEQDALGQLHESDYFLIGRVTYELPCKSWGNIKGGAHLDRMNEIPKLVASSTLSGPGRRRWRRGPAARPGGRRSRGRRRLVRS